MKPRLPDWRSLKAKLRKMRELLDMLVSLGEFVANAVPVAIEQYGRYLREVAGWLAERQNVSGGT
jgi:hypothetical protein